MGCSLISPNGVRRYLQMIQTLKNSMIMVVESLVNRFEEDRLKKEEEEEEEMQGAREKQSSSQFMDNCSDSDSSFNQVNQESPQ